MSNEPGGHPDAEASTLHSKQKHTSKHCAGHSRRRHVRAAVIWICCHYMSWRRRPFQSMAITTTSSTSESSLATCAASGALLARGYGLHPGSSLLVHSGTLSDHASPSIALQAQIGRFCPGLFPAAEGGPHRVPQRGAAPGVGSAGAAFG